MRKTMSDALRFLQRFLRLNGEPVLLHTLQIKGIRQSLKSGLAAIFAFCTCFLGR
jgi:hypothetical protein